MLQVYMIAGLVEIDLYTIGFGQVHQLFIQFAAAYRIDGLSVFAIRLECSRTIVLMQVTTGHWYGN
ncbi:hypothetical protein D3C87_1639940 [compost metagenome]